MRKQSLDRIWLPPSIVGWVRDRHLEAERNSRLAAVPCTARIAAARR
jgi:hypothetical protein